MHEFALSLSQVEAELLIAVAKGLTFVLGQPLVGVHDFETHLMYRCALVLIWSQYAVSQLICL